ncbi:MAG: hypothetical protein VKI82_14360 [Leptolyngbya sp.]|nr:hypothetical protein [Leptolyngbya sp.]
MTLQELQQQITQLTVQDRLQLVQILIASIQQDTQNFQAANSNQSQDETTLDVDLASLHPWPKSFIGILQQPLDDHQGAYIDYLEEKYA